MARGYKSMIAMTMIVGVSFVAHAGTTSYEYDDAGRLKKTKYKDGTVKNNVLDAAGNRQQLTPDASATPSTSSVDPKTIPLAAILSIILN